MNKNKNVVNGNNEKKDNAKFLSENPTRGEIIEIMQQVGDTINQMGDYLMQDVNAMYANQVFPFQLRFAVIEEVVLEKFGISKEEIDEKVNKRYKELEAQAKELKAKQESEAEADAKIEKADNENIEEPDGEKSNVIPMQTKK